MTFGEKIRELRKRKRLSQRDLAEKVGIDFTYLSKIENNKVPPPSNKVISKIARALEADLEKLLTLAPKFSQKELRKAVAQDARVGILFRKLQARDLTDEQLKQMLEIAVSGVGGNAADNK